MLEPQWCLRLFVLSSLVFPFFGLVEVVLLLSQSLVGTPLAGPRPLSDRPPDLLGRFLLAMHLGREECLLDANAATRRVICFEAVQETAMSFPLAVAIARLLRQYFWYFFRSLVCLPHFRLLEARRLQRCWKGHRISGTVVMHRHRSATSLRARWCCVRRLVRED